MSKIIICRGLPGSGKSTWASQWVQEEPHKRIRINWDDMRKMFGGGIKGFWVPKREKLPLLSRTTHMLIHWAMEYNIDVIVDNTNLNPDELDKLLNMVYSATVLGKRMEVYYKNFLTPVDQCIERDSHRERPVGSTLIKNMSNTYVGFYSGEDEGTLLLKRHRAIEIK
jgi:predicted kinase